MRINIPLLVPIVIRTSPTVALFVLARPVKGPAVRLTAHRCYALGAAAVLALLVALPGAATAQAVGAPAAVGVTEASDNPVVVLTDIPGGGATVKPAVTPADIAGPGYTLWTNSDGSVVRWDPCTAIHYRANYTYAPAGAEADVKQAIVILGAQSGLTFINDGSSGEIPQSSYGVGSSPGNRPPLLIAWAAPGTGAGRSNLLPGLPVVGVGGPVIAKWTIGGVTNPFQVITGKVVLDSSASLTPGFGPNVASSRGQLLLHELGHAVGLTHTNDKVQVMYPSLHSSPITDYAPGDRAGLARVGSAAGCIGNTGIAPSAVVPPAAVPAPTDPLQAFWNWLLAMILSWFR